MIEIEIVCVGIHFFSRIVLLQYMSCAQQGILQMPMPMPVHPSPGSYAAIRLRGAPGAI